jgi:hypothetical protein
MSMVVPAVKTLKHFCIYECKNLKPPSSQPHAQPTTQSSPEHLKPLLLIQDWKSLCLSQEKDLKTYSCSKAGIIFDWIVPLTIVTYV